MHMVCMGRMSPPRISTHPPTPQLTCTISMCSIHSYATTTTWCTYSLHLGGVVYSTCYVVCRRLPAVCMVCRSIWGLCAVPQEVVFPTTTISRGVHSRDPGAHHQDHHSGGCGVGWCTVWMVGPRSGSTIYYGLQHLQEHHIPGVCTTCHHVLLDVVVCMAYTPWDMV